MKDRKKRFSSPESLKARLKKNWQPAREKYLWYLKPPFDAGPNKFDRNNWWKDVPGEKIEHAAAIYELARRHPDVGTAMLDFIRNPKKKFSGSQAVGFLRDYGLKSWKTLTGYNPKNPIEFGELGLTRPDGHLGGGGLKESAHE